MKVLKWATPILVPPPRTTNPQSFTNLMCLRLCINCPLMHNQNEEKLFVTLENNFLNDVRPLKCVLRTRLSTLIARKDSLEAKGKSYYNKEITASQANHWLRSGCRSSLSSRSGCRSSLSTRSPRGNEDAPFDPRGDNRQRFMAVEQAMFGVMKWLYALNCLSGHRQGSE